MKKIYLAGGWFTPHTKKIIDILEEELGKLEGATVYSPRRDGTKLTPNQFGNVEIRKKVFQDNVDNILNADFLVASLDGKDGYLDTGTVWEVGFASAHGIPVIGFELDPSHNGNKLLGGIITCLEKMCYGVDSLISTVKTYIEKAQKPKIKFYEESKERYNRVLIIGPDYTQDHLKVSLSIIAEAQNKNLSTRWVDKPSSTPIGEYSDDIFKGVDYMIAVVDDRHPAVAWAMGQAYARKIPIVSFTNHDYGVNLMLLLSIVRHIKGIEKLSEFLEEVNRVGGIRNVEPADHADVRAI